MIRKILLVGIFYSCSAFGGVAKNFQDELVEICGKEIIPIAKKVLIQILRSEKTRIYSCDSETLKRIQSYCPSLECGELFEIYVGAAKSHDEI